MSDFYTLLRQSIIDRDLTTAEERADAYSQARNAVVQRLWSFDPPLSEDEIDIRIGAFDDAVDTIEAEILESIAASEPVDLDEVEQLDPQYPDAYEEEDADTSPVPLSDPSPVSQSLISRSYTTRQRDPITQLVDDGAGEEEADEQPAAETLAGSRLSPPAPPPPVRSPRFEPQPPADHEAPRQRVRRSSPPPAGSAPAARTQMPPAPRIEPQSDGFATLDERSQAVEAALNAALDEDPGQMPDALDTEPDLGFVFEPEAEIGAEADPAPARPAPRKPLFGRRPDLPQKAKPEEPENTDPTPAAAPKKRLPPSPPPPPRVSAPGDRSRRPAARTRQEKPSRPSPPQPAPKAPVTARSKGYRLPPAAESAVQDGAAPPDGAPPREPHPRPKAHPRRKVAAAIPEERKAKPRKRSKDRTNTKPTKEERPQNRRIGILVAAIAALAVGLLVLVGMIFLPSGADSATTEAVSAPPATASKKPFTESITAAKSAIPGLPPAGSDIADRFMVFDGSDRAVFSAAPSNPVRIAEDSARIKTDAGSAGARALVDASIANQLAGKTVKVTLVARSAPANGAAKLRFAYQSGLAISHWQTVDLTGDYQPLSLDWRVPAMRTGTASNTIIIEPGVPGDGTGVDVAAIAIDVLR